MPALSRTAATLVIARAIAALVIARAAMRLAVLERSLPLDVLVEHLREAPRLRGRLADPHLYPPLVDRMLRWLPPHRRLGRCVKRSLLLLELWSRCGLAPTFHYGVGHDADGKRRAHAWLGDVPDDLTAGDPGDGFVETLSV